jgi:hypothetical protein
MNIIETEGPSSAATWSVLCVVAAFMILFLLWIGATYGPPVLASIKGMVA